MHGREDKCYSDFIRVRVSVATLCPTWAFQGRPQRIVISERSMERNAVDSQVYKRFDRKSIVVLLQLSVWFDDVHFCSGQRSFAVDVPTVSKRSFIYLVVVTIVLILRFLYSRCFVPLFS